LQSATVGYWVDAAAQGQGIATAALMTVLPVARNELELHRLEAGASPDNPASTRVLEKAGFTLIGLAPRYLLIGNEWRDQVLYQRVLDDTPPG
jgi:ribosomal-protein-alanine N-acetyltransferase